MPDRMPERQKICQIECYGIDGMLEDMPNRMPEGMPDRIPDRMSDSMPHNARRYAR